METRWETECPGNPDTLYAALVDRINASGLNWKITSGNQSMRTIKLVQIEGCRSFLSILEISVHTLVRGFDPFHP
jgi:hypothetical protein